MADVEICVDNLESCLAAAEGGCSRIELCSSLAEGGLTPTPAFLVAAKKLISVPIFCMVRCRGGDMVYSDTEAELLLHEAEDLVRAGADGLVFGALRSDGSLDEDLCRRMKAVAGALPCTFHRAFDLLSDPVQQLEKIIALGYSRVLTSGCESTALRGAATIKALVQAADGRIGIMAGAGIKSTNVASFPPVLRYHGWSWHQVY
ncbi:copper homeostasis protein cutC homolog isoform X2 [Hyalella azteca]|uniref:Copper homeostasis protein cutC homolog n=1 Tax=Hyalella azteca TaxID=294128 RepID=A0A8B7P5Q5_HYAAZ|nr:copper homeostasis protein cutC homolog isoform X2 [Hyalella azteca]